MPTYQITAPDGKTLRITAPEGATQEEVLAYAQSNYNATPSLPEKMGKSIESRGKLARKIYENEQIPPISKAWQLLTRGGAGTVSDVAGDVIGSTLSAITPEPVKEAGKSALQSLAQTPVGQAVKTGAGMVGQGLKSLDENFPIAYGNVAGALDLAGGLGAVTGAKAIGGGISEGVKAAGRGTIDLGVGTVKGAGTLAKNIAKPISDRIVAGELKSDLAGLAPDMKQSIMGMNPAEQLFIQTLQKEGVSPQQALREYGLAQSMGVSPSVSVTSQIPSMQQQAKLMLGGSYGSRVGEKAIENINIALLLDSNCENCKRELALYLPWINKINESLEISCVHTSSAFLAKFIGLTSFIIQAIII
jgi:hypothetical protein